MKKSLIFLVIIIFAIGFGAYLLSKPKNDYSTPISNTTQNVYEYYWGNGCPHCKIVEEFFETWENKDKVNIVKKEVWYNRVNAQAMLKRIKACGLDAEKTGVPFLYTPEGTCLIGDEPIINHLKSLNFQN